MIILAANNFDPKTETSTPGNLLQFTGTRSIKNSDSNNKFSIDNKTTNPIVFDTSSIKSVPQNKPIPENYFDFLYKDTYNNNKRSNVVSNNSNGDDNMDKILEKYIDKMDRDQSDLRSDIRASEDRIAKSIELSETRNSEKLSNIETMIKDHFNKIDENYNKLEDKIDNNNKFITSISITTIIGIAAMVITIIALVITIILTLQNLPK